jgi:hypothetical protein
MFVLHAILKIACVVKSLTLVPLVIRDILYRQITVSSAQPLKIVLDAIKPMFVVLAIQIMAFIQAQEPIAVLLDKLIVLQLV